MAKKSKTVVKISRKGFIIWGALALFISGWMFVLGILVGRGTAPIGLNAGKLEQELKTLKEAMAEKTPANAKDKDAADPIERPELGFYEALKENKGQRQYKVPAAAKPNPAAKTPAVKPKPVAKPSPPRPSVTKPAPEKKSAPKPAPVAPPQPERAQGRFTIQVAAVKETANAKRLVDDLRKNGYPAYQVRVMVPGKGVWHRVRVGAYTSRDAAEQMLKKLKAGKINGMVVGTN